MLQGGCYAGGRLIWGVDFGVGFGVGVDVDVNVDVGVCMGTGVWWIC